MAMCYEVRTSDPHPYEVRECVCSVAHEWHCSGFLGTTTFFSNRYDSGMDTEKKRELWDRLDNEPERAHRAFQTFLSLPSEDRTLVEAYRGHVGNPQAVKPSDTWV